MFCVAMAGSRLMERTIQHVPRFYANENDKAPTISNNKMSRFCIRVLGVILFTCTCMYKAGAGPEGGGGGGATGPSLSGEV